MNALYLHFCPSSDPKTEPKSTCSFNQQTCAFNHAHWLMHPNYGFFTAKPSSHHVLLVTPPTSPCLSLLCQCSIWRPSFSAQCDVTESELQALKCFNNTCCLTYIKYAFRCFKESNLCGEEDRTWTSIINSWKLSITRTDSKRIKVVNCGVHCVQNWNAADHSFWHYMSCMQQCLYVLA